MPWIVAVGVSVACTLIRAESFVQNPSFEVNYNEAWPHTGDIAAWTWANGAGGVNQADGPFHNVGTAIPDRDRVALHQGGGPLSQVITGLSPGDRYWVQFWYDARACCPGGSVQSIAVKWNDVQIDSIPNVVPATGAPATYYFHSVPFVPDSDTGTLTFDAAVAGDATVLFDAVTIVQRDDGNIVVANPSFEASGPPTFDTGMPPAVHSGELFTEPTELSPAGLAGWTATGRYGISLEGGIYADNGAIPEQDLVAFLEGSSSLSQTIAGLTAGTRYDLSFACNARSGTVPRLQVTVDGAVLLEEDITPVGGTNPYRPRSVSFTAAGTTATISLTQTANTDETLLLDDVRVVGKVVEILPLAFTPTAAELGPSQRATFQVTVPESVLAEQDVDLELAMSRPDVAQLVDTDINGILTLSFAQGGGNVQSFEIEAVSLGTANLQILNLAEYPRLSWPQSVRIEVVQSFVRNASFESTPVPAGAGYGSILAWTGGSGLNVAGGPFADNGIVPDRFQVAFLQGPQTLSQEIIGLTPGKNYWLQFRYDARAFGATAIDLSIRFAGTELERIDDIVAVGVAPGDLPYRFASLQFSPTASSGLLEFVTSVEPGADATLLLDAVSIVERDPGEVVVENPSFEASGSPAGVGYAAPIAGWAITGGSGINIGRVPSGPFTDNGAAPDQDRALFIQNPGRLSQLITGLTPGEDYTLSYSVNRRICCGTATDPPTPPALFHSVSFADIPLVVDEEVLPVGPLGEPNPYLVKYLPFEAPESEGEMVLTTTVELDATILLDDVRIRPGVLGPEVCDNDLDDDGDGKIDCADEECAQLEICQTPPENPFVRADSNNDGVINITDGIFVLNFLFLGGPAPQCADAADSNNDGTANITDGIYILNFLFLGGPAPPAPNPGCGVDPEGDGDGILCETANPGC